MFPLSHYVSVRGLANLSSYKYSGVDNSIIANYVMQPLWVKWVAYLPLWMAPNLVTLTGFAFIILSYLATAYYHPAIRGGGPAWLYVWNAFCMFVYQTMDALDGKQARRTKSSSPLGELFDHGCDAVTTVLGTITLACATEADPHILLITLILMMCAFYCAQWEEYYTGTLTLGYVSVTEAQMGAMGVYLLTAAVGVPWWRAEFSLYGYHLHYGDVPLLITAATTLPTMFFNLTEVVKFHLTHREGKGVTGLTIAIYKLLPAVVLSVGFWMWAQRSNIYHQHTHVFLLTYGFLVANLVGRIVLFRVCAENYQPLQPLILPLFFVYLLPIQLETGYLFLYCVLAIGAYVHFALSVIRDLCRTLGINCLTIRPKS